MSFSTMKEPCKEGCRPYSPLKIVNETKFVARGAAYLCKVTVAARSRFARPPARRVGIAFPCAAAVVCAAVVCAAVGSAQLARRGGESTSAGRLFPLMGLDGARKVRPAHQLHSGHSSPTSLRTQLTNFTPDTARSEC